MRRTSPDLMAAKALVDALDQERTALIAALAVLTDLDGTARACRTIIDVTERLIAAQTEYGYLRLIAP